MRLLGRQATDAKGGAGVMASKTGMTALVFGAMLGGAISLWAQPPPMVALGCCCVAQGKSHTCSEKSQADCLALQPAAPTFAKIADWKKAVAASEAQEAKPLQGGWIAGPCEK